MLNNSELSFRSQMFLISMGIATLSAIFPTTVGIGCKSNFVVSNNLATEEVSKVLPQKDLSPPKTEEETKKPMATPAEGEAEEEVEVPDDVWDAPDLRIWKFKVMPSNTKIIESINQTKSSFDENFQGLKVVMVYSNYVKRLQLVDAKWGNTDLELEEVTRESNAFDGFNQSHPGAYLGQEWQSSLNAGIAFFASKILKAKDIKENVVKIDQRFYYAGVVTAYRKEGDEINTMMRIDIQIVPMPKECVNSP